MAKKNILLRSKLKKARLMLETNNLHEAGCMLEQVVKAGCWDADAWMMLGIVSGKLGRHAEAAINFKKSLEIRPGEIQSLYNLGIALRDSGELDDSLDAFEKVVDQQPDFNEACACLANAYLTLGRLEESTDAFRKALGLQPLNAELHSNLGSVLQARGLIDEAVTSYEKAFQINPDLPAYDSYGSALTAQGDFDRAVAAYREGLRRQPGNSRVHSNLLLTLNYMPKITPEDIYKEHCRWGEWHSNHPGRVKSHDNNRDPDRCLRVGYVSPDFRTHSVAYYIEPLLAAHHRNEVEVFCYSLVPSPDKVTGRLRVLADRWREIHGQTDQQIVKQIQADNIDILVDLAGHTAHNKLTVFACKPAPIQVTYLGYPNTTGLSAIDYRLTDAITDPEGAGEFYTEQLVRLQDSFLCYQPLKDSPPVAPLPAVDRGYVTFGSFNNLAKINHEVVALWSEVIRALPGSRLLIKNISLTDPRRREQIYEQFRSHGLDVDRVELLGRTPTREEHLALYGRVDIGLDTFPYNGTTTTCEALWMGVPVLTLSVGRHAGRVGNSLLNCIGLDEWVTGSPDEFKDRASDLTAELTRLSEIRQGLRHRLLSSPVCDSDKFASKVETAYRIMWRTWCDSGEI